MDQNNILSAECDCEYCKDQRLKKTLKQVGKVIGGFVVTTVLCEVAILAAPFALGVVGFGAGGVRAVSFAARAQSWIGNVRKGSMFARLTSMAMKGALSPGAAQGMRMVFQLVNLGGAAAEAMCKTDKDGNLIPPTTREEWDNLINEAICQGFICANHECRKIIDPKLRFLCTSVCTCPTVIYEKS